MKISPVETDITKLIRAGRLNLAYEVFLAHSVWNRLRRHFSFRLLTRMTGWILASACSRFKIRWSDKDDASDLNPAFALFWKNPNAVGVDLLFRIIWSILRRGAVPTRTWAWFAHWMVFQGDYRSSARLFRAALRGVRQNPRLKGECLSLVANHLYCRLRRPASYRLHRKAHRLLVGAGDKFFQMFNLGVWIRLSAFQGSRECLDEILSHFDQLNPARPDERYGLRLLIYAAYVHEITGDRQLTERFEATAAVVYSSSGSELDKAIYHAIRCLIRMQRLEKVAASLELREARVHLGRYGQYSYYSQFFKLLAEAISKIPEDGAAMLKESSAEPSAHDPLAGLLNSYGAISFEEFCETLESAALLKVVTTERLPDDVAYDPLFQIRGQISTTEFLMNLRYLDVGYRLRLRSSFMPWRNPVDFNSTKSLLLALQGHCFREQARRTSRLASLAKEVAHDIRSPIAALQAIRTVDEGMSPEGKEIVDHVVDRIRSVANRVLEADRDPAASFLLPSQVLTVVTRVIGEKRLEHGARIELEAEDSAISCADRFCVDAQMFCSILSNLINNSIESMSGPQFDSVRVKLSATATRHLEVSVEDSGAGIPPPVLARLGSQRVSFGKKEGNGIGLLTARRAIESWGGALIIDSELGRGTRVGLRFVGARSTVTGRS
jgi:signal transduction histidine kinase